MIRRPHTGTNWASGMRWLANLPQGVRAPITSRYWNSKPNSRLAAPICSQSGGTTNRKDVNARTADTLNPGFAWQTCLI